MKKRNLVLVVLVILSLSFVSAQLSCNENEDCLGGICTTLLTDIRNILTDDITRLQKISAIASVLKDYFSAVESGVSGSCASIKTIILLIDTNIYEGIRNSIDQFARDLRSDGYSVITKVSSMQTPEEIRGYLAQLYETVSPSLIGAFLIGDIPRPYYHLYIPSVNGSPERGPYEDISFQFYQDLDGKYARLNPGDCEHPGCYDSHTEQIDSEIWISVLPFAHSTTNTIDKINYYFQKNHDYRLGVNRPKKGFLRPLIGTQIDTPELYNHQLDIIINGDSAWKPLTTRGNIGVYPDNSIGDPINYPNATYGYETAILSGDYDFAFVGAHGSPTGFFAIPMESGSISINTDWVNTHSVKSTFVWDTSCNNGNIDYNDIIKPNILTAFVYSNSSVLLAFGKTGDGGGLGANINGSAPFNIGQSLADGKSMGEAFLDHMNAPFEGSNLQQKEYLVGPAIFIGDLTLKLQEHMS